MSRVTRWGRYSLLWAACYYVTSRTRRPLATAALLLILFAFLLVAAFVALPAILGAWRGVLP